MDYVQEKIAVVNSEPRPNAARTFLAALKGDWKLPVKRKPPPKPKPKPQPVEKPPVLSPGEEEEGRRLIRESMREFKERMRGGPRENTDAPSEKNPD